MEAPTVLYHYTDGAGLLGIVESQAIWASDVEFLNDAQELVYARDAFYDELQKRADELYPADEPDDGPDEVGLGNYSRATVIRSAADHLNPGGQFAAKAYPAVYVACFCES